jgi:hypothetical protein
MVGINRSDVAVPTVHAALALPIINDPLQTPASAAEVGFALDLSPALRRRDAPLAIHRISPPTSVAGLVLLTLLRPLPLLGLSLSTDDGETAVAPRLSIEG